MYLGRKRAGSSFDSEEITDKFNKLTGKGIFVDRNKRYVMLELSKPFPLPPQQERESTCISKVARNVKSKVMNKASCDDQHV